MYCERKKHNWQLYILQNIKLRFHINHKAFEQCNNYFIVLIVIHPQYIQTNHK